MRMKIFLISFICFNAVFAIQSCSNGKEKHLGEWKAESGGQVGSLILDKTNHAILVLGNQVIGGDNFVVQGKTGECKYEIDYSKKPIWLDLVVYEPGRTDEAGRLKGIVRFITDHKMEYRVSFEGGLKILTRKIRRTRLFLTE